MKRWMIRILVCLILGAITTVAVAWGIAFVFWTVLAETEPLSRKHGRYSIGTEHLSITRYEFRGTAYITGVASAEGLRSPGEFTPLLLRNELELVTSPRPRGSTVGLAFDWWENVGAGWPMIALWMEYEQSPNSLRGSLSLSHRWAMRLPMKQRHGPIYPRQPTLPLRPIWPGFVIDTLFYGAIWGGVWFGFVGGKRFIRSKRGRCPRCGYDLRGNLAAGCSECGWNRGEMK